MKTIKEVLQNFHQVLGSLYDRREAEAITLMVLTELTDLTRSKIKAFPETELPVDVTEKLPEILADLETGKPVQYVLGITEFYGLPYLVNPAVLIPRPETEELVEWILTVFKNKLLQNGALSILDIGTGSGCIAISLKKNLQDAQITAIDISADALQTARQNALLNGASVEFMQTDILQSHEPKKDDLMFDIIVSNPPYVTLKDKLLMHENVTEFEPHGALFVPEHDPLVFYKAIAGYAIKHLAVNGYLFLEINENFGKETVNLLCEKGFKNIELRKDMSGRDRMVKAEF